MVEMLPHSSQVVDSTSSNKKNFYYSNQNPALLRGFLFIIPVVIFMSSVSFDSPAKVNLFLNVLGKRDDGYHDLESIFLKIPIFDSIEIDTGFSSFSFTCDNHRIPCDDSNLVVKAAKMFFEAAGLEIKGKIHLKKSIPSEAGMGGGSGNAAITLKALNNEFGGPLSNSVLHELAAKLGSDVPFFLMGSQALGTGRGEVLTDLPHFSQVSDSWLVIAKPDFGVPTGWAFNSLKEHFHNNKMEVGAAASLAESLSQDSEVWPRADSFFNSFELPVFNKFPLLAWVKNLFLENGANAALLSGSGSAVFGLFGNKSDAERSFEILESEAGDSTWKKIVAMNEMKEI